MKIEIGALLVNNKTMAGLYSIGVVVEEKENKDIFADETKYMHIYWLPINNSVPHRVIDVVSWIENNSVQYWSPPK